VIEAHSSRSRVHSCIHGSAVRKTTTRLADGRELIYYDTLATTHRNGEDLRPSESSRLVSELRYDPMLDSWVMYASHRQERCYLPASDDCPLCPSKADHLTEIPEPDYEVVVFENRFPAPTRGSPAALSLEGATRDKSPVETDLAPMGPLFRRRPAGRCEVVCYTADHDAAFAQLAPERGQPIVRRADRPYVRALA
jgi:UDPglucose--hexose-1-phosphate uridylyltransferase